MWTPVVGISGKFPSDVDATNLGTTLGEPAVYPGLMDPYKFNSSKNSLTHELSRKKSHLFH